MTDPTPERIAAALRLAEADCAMATAIDNQGGIPPETYDRLFGERIAAMRAYRATLPKLRSRAEVDAEIATVCRMAYGAATIGTAFYRERVEKLCDEPTAPEPAPTGERKPLLWCCTDCPNSVACKAARQCSQRADGKPEPAAEAEPEPCGCEESVALKAKLAKSERTVERITKRVASWRAADPDGNTAMLAELEWALVGSKAIE